MSVKRMNGCSVRVQHLCDVSGSDSLRPGTVHRIWPSCFPAFRFRSLGAFGRAACFVARTAWKARGQFLSVLFSDVRLGIKIAHKFLIPVVGAFHDSWSDKTCFLPMESLHVLHWHLLSCSSLAKCCARSSSSRARRLATSSRNRSASFRAGWSSAVDGDAARLNHMWA